MNWSVVKCQYEGGGYGLVVDILVETEDINEAHDLIHEVYDDVFNTSLIDNLNIREE